MVKFLARASDEKSWVGLSTQRSTGCVTHGHELVEVVGTSRLGERPSKGGKAETEEEMIAGHIRNTNTREIRLLLNRLQAFEQLPKTETNRSIIEIGIATIREKLRDLSRFTSFRRGVREQA